MATSTAQQPEQQLRNVIVAGGSYVGLATAKELMSTLPPTHRVIVIDPRSHFSHLFAFPRFAISGPAHKAFIPVSLPSPHLILRAAGAQISPNSILLDRAVTLDGIQTEQIPFDALVVSTGTKLSPPGTMPGESKKEGIEYLKSIQEDLSKAKKIVILGGGAVGVQMATDLATIYERSKEVTLVQSRTLMPRFHPKLHELCMKRFEELGIKTVLGSRAVVPEGGFEGATEVRTEAGKVTEADFVIQSTGQTPNSQALASAFSSAVNESGFIKVKPTFEIAPSAEKEAAGARLLFAVGDIADSGAPKAARPGMAQAAIVARNIASLIAGSPSPSFEQYKPDPAAIHLTLGVVESVIFRNPPSSDPSRPLETFEGEPIVMWKDDGKLEMGIEGVWERRAAGVAKTEADYWL